MGRLLRSAMVLVLGASLVGCAASGLGWPARDRTDGPSVTIEVWHNAPVAAALNVNLVSPDGMVERLGRVSPSGTGRFAVREARVGDYRLTAETTDGRWIRSGPFSLIVSGGVRWDVDRNRISSTWEDDP